MVKCYAAGEQQGEIRHVFEYCFKWTETPNAHTPAYAAVRRHRCHRLKFCI